MSYIGLFIILFILLPAIIGGIVVYVRFLPKRKQENAFEFVFIEKDGTVRELTGDEEDYLNQPFFPGDINRPQIKKTYEDRIDGDISGFILRERIPEKILIRKRNYRFINPN